MAPKGRRERRRARRRERRAARHEESPSEDSRGEPSGGPPGVERYRMTQRLVSIGDDYTVRNAADDPVFDVDGKALRIRETLKMTDRRTGDVYEIQERLARVRDTMTVEKNGEPAATVKKALVSPLRDRFTLSIAGVGDLRVQGNVFDHEYDLFRDGERVARVSKSWFRVRDSYGIEVSTAVDTGLVVACAVVLDTMVRPER